MKTLLIIQARMGSTRLPGKVLSPLGHATVLDYVLERSREIVGVSEVCVATSTLPGDAAIVRFCAERAVRCVRGSETDVLARFCDAARLYDPQCVVRVTADCPFLDIELANRAVQAMDSAPVDLVRVVEGEQLPRGLLVEAFSYAALQWMNLHTTQARHREHVTYYMYEYPKDFRFGYIAAPVQLHHPELRLTVDTPEDLALARRVADAFAGDALVPARRIVQWLLEHPDIAALNAHVQQAPVV